MAAADDALGVELLHERACLQTMVQVWDRELQKVFRRGGLFESDCSDGAHGGSQYEGTEQSRNLEHDVGDDVVAEGVCGGCLNWRWRQGRRLRG